MTCQNGFLSSIVTHLLGERMEAGRCDGGSKSRPFPQYRYRANYLNTGLVFCFSESCYIERRVSEDCIQSFKAIGLNPFIIVTICKNYFRLSLFFGGVFFTVEIKCILFWSNYLKRIHQKVSSTTLEDNCCSLKMLALTFNLSEVNTTTSERFCVHHHQGACTGSVSSSSRPHR